MLEGKNNSFFYTLLLVDSSHGLVTMSWFTTQLLKCFLHMVKCRLNKMPEVKSNAVALLHTAD